MRQPPHRRPTSGVDGCRACLCEYTIIKTTPNVNTVTSMQFAELRVIRRRQTCTRQGARFARDGRRTCD